MDTVFNRFIMLKHFWMDIIIDCIFTAMKLANMVCCSLFCRGVGRFVGLLVGCRLCCYVFFLLRKGEFHLDGSINAYVYVYGFQAAMNANFSVRTPTAYFNFFGFYAGRLATIDCQSSSTCYINCLGNGCDGLTLICSGTCVISCDESMNIDCPNGYVGPTPGPTYYPTFDPTKSPSDYPTPDPTARPTPRPTSNPTKRPTDLPSPFPTPSPTDPPADNPTNNPTVSPTGGTSESVSCDSIEQCMGVSSLFGTTVDCSGKRSCYGVTTITSFSGQVLYILSLN